MPKISSLVVSFSLSLSFGLSLSKRSNSFFKIFYSHPIRYGIQFILSSLNIISNMIALEMKKKPAFFFLIQRKWPWIDILIGHKNNNKIHPRSISTIHFNCHVVRLHPIIVQADLIHILNAKMSSWWREYRRVRLHF